MTSKLSLLFKKYTVPTIFTILGIIMVVMGLKSQQNTEYVIATVMMFVAGALSFLYSSGAISSKILSILGFVALLGSAGAMYQAWASVRSTTIHNKNYARCVALARLNLTDIRATQKAYAEVNGVYANSWEKVVDFAKNGMVPVVEAEGTVPPRPLSKQEIKFLYNDNRAADDNMTEQEAVRLSRMETPPMDLQNFRRDTVMKPFRATKFDTRSYQESRENKGYPRFYADSLPYIPMSGGQMWKLETKDSIPFGDAMMPAIRVSGILPYAKIEGTKKEEIYFGKLTMPETAGSWEE